MMMMMMMTMTMTMTLMMMMIDTRGRSSGRDNRDGSDGDEGVNSSGKNSGCGVRDEGG